MRGWGICAELHILLEKINEHSNFLNVVYAVLFYNIDMSSLVYYYSFIIIDASIVLSPYPLRWYNNTSKSIFLNNEFVFKFHLYIMCKMHSTVQHKNIIV